MVPTRLTTFAGVARHISRRIPILAAPSHRFYNTRTPPIAAASPPHSHTTTLQEEPPPAPAELPPLSLPSSPVQHWSTLNITYVHRLAQRYATKSSKLFRNDLLSRLHEAQRGRVLEEVGKRVWSERVGPIVNHATQTDRYDFMDRRSGKKVEVRF